MTVTRVITCHPKGSSTWLIIGSGLTGLRLLGQKPLNLEEWKCFLVMQHNSDNDRLQWLTRTTLTGSKVLRFTSPFCLETTCPCDHLCSHEHGTRDLPCLPAESELCMQPFFKQYLEQTVSLLERDIEVTFGPTQCLGTSGESRHFPKQTPQCSRWRCKLR